ncbi:hypothetical protein ACFVFI_37030, partial [Streptomyces sp. NPDC057705]
MAGPSGRVHRGAPVRDGGGEAACCRVAQGAAAGVPRVGPDGERGFSEEQFGGPAEQFQPGQVEAGRADGQRTGRPGVPRGGAGQRAGGEGHRELGQLPRQRSGQGSAAALPKGGDPPQCLTEPGRGAEADAAVRVAPLGSEPAVVVGARGAGIGEEDGGDPGEQPRVVSLGCRVGQSGGRAHQPVRGGAGQQRGERARDLLGLRRGTAPGAPLPVGEPGLQGRRVGAGLGGAAGGGHVSGGAAPSGRDRPVPACAAYGQQDPVPGQTRVGGAGDGQTAGLQRPYGGGGERVGGVARQDLGPGGGEGGGRVGGAPGHGV